MKMMETGTKRHAAEPRVAARDEHALADLLGPVKRHAFILLRV